MLELLFPFLDLAVLEQQQDGSFRRSGDLPAWFFELYPDSALPDGTVVLNSPFLADFLERASELWKDRKDGSIPSGAWTETDPSGRDRMLQATAIQSSGRRILLIEPARVPLEEAQVLLQKGRQKSLDFRTVKTRQKSLRKVVQRYYALLDAVPDWVLVIHQDGSILEHSAGRDELFESEKIRAGAKVEEALPRDLALQMAPLLKKVISSGNPQIWRYRESSTVLEVLMIPSGQDEAMCILRRRGI